MSDQMPTYTIYQVKNGAKYWDYLFTNTHHLTRLGLPVDPANYDKVYSGTLAPGETLENLFDRFNTYHPADYRGRSMSVSDVVVLDSGGKQEAYFCDTSAFHPLDRFTRAPHERSPKRRSKAHAER